MNSFVSLVDLKASLLEAEVAKGIETSRLDKVLLAKGRYRIHTCRRCKRKGHIEKYCRVKPVESPKETQGEGQPGNKNLCWNCDQPGHRKADCKAPAKAMIAFGTEGERDAWPVDCGTSSHMCKNFELMKDVTKLDKEHPITIGDGTDLFATHIGEVELLLRNRDSFQSISLKQVFYVPNLSSNLFFVTSCVNSGFQIVFQGTHLRIYDPKERRVLGHGKLERGLWYLDTNTLVGGSAFVAKSGDESLWHQRLGHFGYTTLGKVSPPWLMVCHPFPTASLKCAKLVMREK